MTGKKTYILLRKREIKNGNEVIDEYGKVKYLKPVKYRFNVQPIGGTTNSTSGRTDVMAYGQKAMQMQRAIVDYKTYFGKFEVDDLAYLDGVTSTGETVNGEKANYRVDAVLNQNKVIAIYFEKLTEK